MFAHFMKFTLVTIAQIRVRDYDIIAMLHYFQQACYFEIRAEFYGIELWMLKKAIQALAKQGKAELIPGSSPDDSDAGVKFFS